MRNLPIQYAKTTCCRAPPQISYQTVYPGHYTPHTLCLKTATNMAASSAYKIHIMLALCASSCLALAPSAGLLPEHERPQLPDVRSNKTAFITLAAAQDPCQIDPAVCAGASQDVKDDASQRYDAPVFTSSLRLASVMLNLHSVAHMMKQTDLVIVFPGYAEDERMEAAIAYAERLSAGTLFVAGPPESDKDSALEWTLPKIQAKRTALGFGKSTPPYGIVIESEAADTKKQAEQVASFFKETRTLTLTLT